MLNNLKSLQSGNLEEVNNQMLYPLLRWLSGDVNNLQHCSLVNKYFFFIPQDMSKSLLYLGLVPTPPFLKYPKSKLEENEKLQILKPYIKKMYGWGEREFSTNAKFILDDIEAVIIDVIRYGGLNDKELKILGIKKEKIEKLEPKADLGKWL